MKLQKKLKELQRLEKLKRSLKLQEKIEKLQGKVLEASEESYEDSDEVREAPEV
jgi:hypothetical protein